MTAPVVTMIGHDLTFPEQFKTLLPHKSDIGSLFEWSDELRTTTAFRNGSLLGAYLMPAARALGLDCGPKSGFDNELIDAEFFPEQLSRAILLLPWDPAILANSFSVFPD